MSSVKLDCAGKLTGMHIKLKQEMVARVSFNEAAQQTFVELKADQSCHILTESGRLASFTFLGASIPVAGTVTEVREKLGFKS